METNYWHIIMQIPIFITIFVVVRFVVRYIVFVPKIFWKHFGYFVFVILLVIMMITIHLFIYFVTGKTQKSGVYPHTFFASKLYKTVSDWFKKKADG